MSAIEERIRKLLALADSPNENEAAAAAEKAQTGSGGGHASQSNVTATPASRPATTAAYPGRPQRRAFRDTDR